MSQCDERLRFTSFAKMGQIGYKINAGIFSYSARIQQVEDARQI
jgi:hypothetical protein